MADVLVSARGNVSALAGEAVVEVRTNLDLVAAGQIGALDGDAAISVFGGGRRTLYTVLRDDRLAGVRAFAPGRGLLVAAGCRDSRKVLLLDTTSARKIRVYAESEDLGLPVVDIVADNDHIFAFLNDAGRGVRRLAVVENNAGLAVVSMIDLAKGDTSAWIAIRPDAGVLAHPAGSGTVVVRSTTAPFPILAAFHEACGDTATAVWFRYALSERPEEVDEVERHWYLYVVQRTHAEAKVFLFRRFVRDGEDPVDDIRFHGIVPMRDAQQPVRIGSRACSVLSGGSVTNRGAITPTFDGAFQLAPGRWVTFWGYDNQSAAIAEIPLQETGVSRNHFIGRDARSQALLPTIFNPGRVVGSIILFTSGEAVTWELRGHPGGGVAVADYTRGIDPTALVAFAGFIVKQHAPSAMRYFSQEPLTIEQVETVRFGQVTLNNAGFNLDQSAFVRHTVEPNDDLPGMPHWYPRDIACRIEGGLIQAHANEGRVSRLLFDELERERAKGVLFNLPETSVTLEPIFFAPVDIAQAGERMGWEIGHSADGSVIALSAEIYSNPETGFANEGRVHVWLRQADGSYRHTDVFDATRIPEDAWQPVAANTYFSRFTEVSPDGSLLFIGSKRGPGIAVFQLSSLGVASYWKTLTWPAYTGMPLGERAHEARFDETGRLFFLTTASFSRGDSTRPGEFHVLFSDDGWQTYEVRQAGQTRPGGAGTIDCFSTLDVSRDGTTFVIGAWEINRIYSFRSSDEWKTYETYELATPAGVTAFDTAVGVPLAESVQMGVSVGTSHDGFRVVSVTRQTWNYETGLPEANDTTRRTGAVWMWLFNAADGDYGAPQQIQPPVSIPEPAVAGNTLFGGAIRFNGPGFRFSCFIRPGGTSLARSMFLYGIHAEQTRSLAAVEDALVVASADTRWLGTTDTLIVANRVEDNPDGAAAVGAFRAIRFAEVP